MGIATNNYRELERTQVDREQSMLNEGRERYHRRNDQQHPSNRNVEHSLVTNAIERVSTEITRAIKEEEHRLGKRCTSFKSEWFDDLVLLDADILAYISLNQCFNHASIKNTFTQTLVAIGTRVELEVWSAGLREFDRHIGKLVTNQATSGHSSFEYRRRNALRAASKFGYQRDKWTRKKKVKCASVLLNAVLSHSDLFEIFETGSFKDTKRFVVLTDVAYELVKDGNFDASFTEPMFSTMVCPPRPWVSTSTGCYLDPALNQTVPLVRQASKAQMKAIKHDFDQCASGEVPKYIKALNILQSTPLQINKTVLETVVWCWEGSKKFGSFPSSEELPKPEKLSDEVWASLTDNQKAAKRQDGRDWRQNVLDVKASQCIMQQTLATSKEMLGYDRFYLPWNFDFRGRLYPVSIFNYHRDDCVKAQFQFADGKPLGEYGAAWLMIHLANVGDFNKISKQPLQERVRWVEDNQAMIEKVGRYPKESFEIWKKADKPFQFIAACEAYCGYLDEGDSYVCHIAPSLDGTNSGTQHYAAILRSKKDGAMVNLTKSNEVQDIYKIVADAVTSRIKTEKSEFKKRWLDYKISRSVTKRNTMVYSYSSTPIGMSNQLQEDLMDKLQKDKMYGLIKDHPFGDSVSQKKHCNWLANINYEEIGKILSSVRDGMKFLQAAAHTLALENKSCRWRSPSGFPAVQNYTKWTKTKVRIYLYDREAKINKRSQVTVKGPEPTKTDSRKAKSSIAANWIHSCDAAHMVNTILLSYEHGLRDFMVIHDSFATTACNTIDLFQIVREAFVIQYTGECPLESFLEGVRQQLNDPTDARLLEVPPKGDLDIYEVLESDYCFS